MTWQRPGDLEITSAEDHDELFERAPLLRQHRPWALPEAVVHYTFWYQLEGILERCFVQPWSGGGECPQTQQIVKARLLGDLRGLPFDLRADAAAQWLAAVHKGRWAAEEDPDLCAVYAHLREGMPPLPVSRLLRCALLGEWHVLRTSEPQTVGWVSSLKIGLRRLLGKVVGNALFLGNNEPRAAARFPPLENWVSLNESLFFNLCPTSVIFKGCPGLFDETEKLAPGWAQALEVVKRWDEVDW